MGRQRNIKKLRRTLREYAPLAEDFFDHLQVCLAATRHLGYLTGSIRDRVGRRIAAESQPGFEAREFRDVKVLT